jgi:hypothetical protein
VPGKNVKKEKSVVKIEVIMTKIKKGTNSDGNFRKERRKNGEN